MNLQFRTVASPYCFLEAPRSDGEVLWFTDLLLGGLYRLSPQGKIDAFLGDTKHIGGVVINEDGAIICGGSAGLTWLDPKTGEQFPRTGTAKGHLGLFDLLPESYWGGFLTGDEVTLSWSDAPCKCGRHGAYIHPGIRRYSDREGGDGKITCAGAPEAHDEALKFLERLG